MLQGYIDLYRNAAKEIEAEPFGITGEASSNTYTAAMGVYLRCVGVWSWLELARSLDLATFWRSNGS